MEISGGSLGQGLAIAVGMALALKHKGNPAFVYNSMSDGELDEGSTWEAAMGAAHHGLDNLICLVDINNQQADGPSGKVLGFEPLADKWAAFGWHVQRVDGNDLPAVLQAFDAARALARREAARDPVRHADGQGRAVPRAAREEPLHPRRPARVAAGDRRARRSRSRAAQPPKERSHEQPSRSQRRSRA